MDVKEYIASGILESYATGTATSQERQEVECMAAIYPEIREELEQISFALERYARLNAAKPAAAVRSKIMAQLDAVTPEATVKQKPATTAAKVVDFKNYFRYSVAASVVLLALMAFGMMRMQKDVNESRARLEQMNNETKSMQASFEALRDLKEDQAMMMSIMKDTMNMTAPMKAVPGKDRNANASVYWNKSTREVILTVDMLPAPPQGMQYQLWAIVDGKPVDAGVFAMNNSMYYKMKNVSDVPAAFAVTLEKMGGVPQPTMDQMYVMGTVKSL